jgi:hypothetical protein
VILVKENLCVRDRLAFVGDSQNFMLLCCMGIFHWFLVFGSSFGTISPWRNGSVFIAQISKLSDRHRFLLLVTLVGSSTILLVVSWFSCDCYYYKQVKLIYAHHAAIVSEIYTSDNVSPSCFDCFRVVVILFRKPYHC